jgi:LuxR family maltose regulon positive regulatory protein
VSRISAALPEQIASEPAAPPGALTFPFDLAESRLRTPKSRRGTVHRTALLERMNASSAPVLAVVGPAGFGKTTLLAQWAESRAPRVAWFTIDAPDNDPHVLAAHLVAAVAAVEPAHPRVVDAIESRRLPTTLIERTAVWLDHVDTSLAFVIDNVDALHNPTSVSVLTQLALTWPFHHRLVVATREAMSWPAGRFRAEGRIAEFGTKDLALDVAEACELLDRSGVELSQHDTDQLIEHCDGWAAGLYLSALAVQAGAASQPLAMPHGDHPYFSEYFRTELLDRVAADELQFLARTSIFDRLNGSLIDSVLDVADSDDRLQDLSRRNLMLLAVDDPTRWYRYHPLFRDLLRAELDRRERDLVPTLQQRAAAWYEANGFPEAAIAHAQSGRDVERLVRLLREHVGPVFESGRSNTVMSWLDWLAEEDLIDADAELAVYGSLMYATEGRPVEVERWADAAERAPMPETLPDGSSGASMLLSMRAFLCRSGIDASCADAAAAYEGLSPTHHHRAGMLFTVGMSCAIQNANAEADAILMRAYDAAFSFTSWPLAAMILAERAAIAAASGDWESTNRFVDEAVDLVGNGTYDAYWSSALVFAWAARTALYRNDRDRAKEFLIRASRIRPLLTYALPVVSLRALIELARAYLGLADAAGARSVLRQANDILMQRPNVGRLAVEVRALREQVDVGAASTIGASSLTAAELRLVPLLSTHLSLQAIADQLYLSRNTVKSQAISIYRKFGVSSRSEAIACLRESGLLLQ